MPVKLSTFLFSGLCLSFCGIFYISLPPAHQSAVKPVPVYHVQSTSCSPKFDDKLQSKFQRLSEDPHNLAVIVPFRDRFEELMEFVPKISSFLTSQSKNFHIFIINQVDNLRFNRALLLNAGYLETPNEFDYLAFHDVDLIPINKELLYTFPSEGLFHVSAPYLHPRYHYPTFIGGILLVRRDHFAQVDGMSTKYWGWGLEDDEFFARLKDADLQVFRPANLSTGTKDTFRHIHDRRIRRRDMLRCHNQQEITRRRDRKTGLSSTKYKVLSRKELTIDGYPFSVLNMQLECDYSVTPWCNCTSNVGNTPNSDGNSIYKDKSDVIVPKINRKKHISPGG